MQTAIVVGAMLLLVVVMWFVWAGRRKKVTARVVERAQSRRRPAMQQAALPEPASSVALPDAKPGMGQGSPLPPPQSIPVDGVAPELEKPAAASPPTAAVTCGAVQLSLDGDSGPVYSPPPVVEELPEVATRTTRETPRVPMVATGSSIGSYRMVRPSEPEVLTPPPSTTPTPGARTSGESSPGPRLLLGGKMLGVIRSPGPATVPQASGDSSPLSDPQYPAPRTSGGTMPGVDPKKPAK